MMTVLIIIQRPQDIIIFMIGGTTYEESRHVELLNHELLSTTGNTHGPTGTRVLLGGTCIHNSARFVFVTLYKPYS
jgi:hypothetical protein